MQTVTPLAPDGARQIYVAIKHDKHLIPFISIMFLLNSMFIAMLPFPS